MKKALKPYMERQQVTVQLFSSLKKQGIEEVEKTVQAWFDAVPVVSENDDVTDTDTPSESE